MATLHHHHAHSPRSPSNAPPTPIPISTLPHNLTQSHTISTLPSHSHSHSASSQVHPPVRYRPPTATSSSGGGGGGSGGGGDQAMGSPKKPSGPLPLKPKAVRFLRKFGPVILIITLLFAVKYLLIAIHLNVHGIRADMAEDAIARCDMLNASAWTNLETGKNEQWVQHRMVGRGTYGFVQWSSYRTSATDITAIGFGAVILRHHRQVPKCMWHGNDGLTLMGKPNVLYPEFEEVPKDVQKHHQYEAMLIHCLLESPIVSTFGGHLVVVIDGEHVVAYREEAASADGQVSVPAQREQMSVGGGGVTARKYRTTFCTFPVVDAVDGERMREWLDIHRQVGAEHVLAYDAGGFDAAAVTPLRPYLRSGFLEVTMMRHIVQFDITSHGILIAMHDCLYRSALEAAWVVYLDWDDVLHVHVPPTLEGLLHDNDGRPWMSYGCRVFSTEECLKDGAHLLASRGAEGRKLGAGGDAAVSTANGRVPFPQERMPYHWPHYLCGDDGPPVKDKGMCLGLRGMRYLIVNPAKVLLLRQHEVVEPGTGGIDLHADDVRHDRFEAIHKRSARDKWCAKPHSASENVEWWVKGAEVQDLVTAVRKKLRETYSSSSSSSLSFSGSKSASTSTLANSRRGWSAGAEDSERFPGSTVVGN